jgi:hypothetical protein
LTSVIRYRYCMGITHLYTSNQSREGVRNTMGDQFTVDIEIVFLDGCTQGWNIDRDVYDSEE